MKIPLKRIKALVERDEDHFCLSKQGSQTIQMALDIFLEDLIQQTIDSVDTTSSTIQFGPQDVAKIIQSRSQYDFLRPVLSEITESAQTIPAHVSAKVNYSARANTRGLKASSQSTIKEQEPVINSIEEDEDYDESD